MTITSEVRNLVRQRAGFACEFCGITETNAGSVLTIDHYQPRARGGSDEPENLVYCCARCNQYEADYWTGVPDAPAMWNPRLEQSNAHFVEMEDGTLQPLTAVGAFTRARLRLNRQPLVTCRLRKRKHADEALLLARYRELVEALSQLNGQLNGLLDEQRRLLHEQQELLKSLLRSRLSE